MPWLRRAVALAGATCALLAATTIAAHAGPAAGPPGNGRPGSCADVAFLGARGSGEAPGLGTTMRDAADRYQHAVGPAASVETRPVAYPAVAVFDLDALKRLQRAVADARLWRWQPDVAEQRPPIPGLGRTRSAQWLLSSRTKYDNSVVEGTKNIRAQLSSVASRCPNTRFVLAGYSQGAQVVTRFLESIDTADPAGRALSERIIGIALFGSPMFAQYDPVQVNRSRQGPAPYSFLRQGVYQTLNDLPVGEPSVLSRQPWVSRTHSYCLQRDVVCQSSSPLYRLFQFLGVDEGPSAIEPHLRYRDYYTQDAASWLAGLTGPALRRDDPRVAVPR